MLDFPENKEIAETEESAGTNSTFSRPMYTLCTKTKYNL